MKYRFDIHHRFKTFFSRFNLAGLRSGNLLVPTAGWIVSFCWFAISSHYDAGGSILAAILFSIALVHIAKKIKTIVDPPTELLMLVFYVLFSVQAALIPSLAGQQSAGISVGVGWAMLQIILLGLYFFLLFQIITQNSESPWSELGQYLLMAVILFRFDEHSGLLFILYQIVLFLMLLRSTNWTTLLTRAECYIAIVVVFLIWDSFSGFDPFQGLTTASFQSAAIFFVLPAFLFLVFKLYLLALLLKIPMVVVYNHATLSRKLRMAFFFTSSMPQFFQFIMLSLFFLFLIAGWQGQHLQSGIKQEVKASIQGKNARLKPVFQFIQPDSSAETDYPNFWEPYIKNNRQRSGIVVRPIDGPGTDQAPDDASLSEYYFFFKDLAPDSSSRLTAFEVDSTFLRTISRNANFPLGTLISAAVVLPGSWSKLFYRNSLWQDNDGMSILPVALYHSRLPSNFLLKLPENQIDSEHGNIDFDLQLDIENTIGFGRVYLPMYENGREMESIFSLNVLYQITSIRWTGFLKLFLILMLAYSILNSLLIQRVARLGTMINDSIVQKFKILQNGISEISGGNLSHKIKMGGEDEFVALAEQFNLMGGRLEQTIAEEREKERLRFELQNARDVQLSLLPAALPKIPDFGISASLHTATEVGGDFYDVYPLDDRRFLVTIGDVSGKGSSAAMYMAQCLSLIRFAGQFNDDPREIVLRLNDYFTAPSIDRQIFVTVILGVLDSANGQFTYVRAGHNLPLFYGRDAKQAMEFLASKGLGIGLSNDNALIDNAFELKTITFNPGDTLVMYTDGIVEASRPANLKAGIREADSATDNNLLVLEDEGFLEILEQFRGADSEGIVAAVDRALHEFYQKHPRVDDHTIVVLQRDL